MTTQGIKPIKVLSITATVAVPEETQHKNFIKTNSLIKMKNYYLFGGHPLHSK